VRDVIHGYAADEGRQPTVATAAADNPDHRAGFLWRGGADLWDVSRRRWRRRRCSARLWTGAWRWTGSRLRRATGGGRRAASSAKRPLDLGPALCTKCHPHPRKALRYENHGRLASYRGRGSPGATAGRQTS
jgi:hypothetical protein